MSQVDLGSFESELGTNLGGSEVTDLIRRPAVFRFPLIDHFGSRSLRQRGSFRDCIPNRFAIAIGVVRGSRFELRVLLTIRSRSVATGIWCHPGGVALLKTPLLAVGWREQRLITGRSRNGRMSFWACGPMKISRFFPFHAVLCLANFAVQTSPVRSIIPGVSLHTSPGRMPQSC